MEHTRKLHTELSSLFPGKVFRMFSPEAIQTAVVISEGEGPQVSRSDMFDVDMQVQIFSPSLSESEDIARQVHQVIYPHTPKVSFDVERDGDVIYHIVEFSYTTSSKL